MTVHLVKLCVGATDIADLAAWIARRKKIRRGRAETLHVTRQTPKREEELLDGGSLYWVIKGSIRVRQRILELRPTVDDEGVPACALVLDPALVPTALKPQRPFQGWRYLDPKAAPRDTPAGASSLPERLQAELAELGLL